MPESRMDKIDRMLIDIVRMLNSRQYDIKIEDGLNMLYERVMEMKINEMGRVLGGMINGQVVGPFRSVYGMSEEEIVRRGIGMCVDGMCDCSDCTCLRGWMNG